MVKEINKIAEQWSKDSKKKLDDFESFLNALVEVPMRRSRR